MKKNKAAVIAEYLRGGSSYRELGKKYGVHFGTVGKWINEVASGENKVITSGSTPRVVADLQKELEALQLKNKLLEAMLDIASEQYGEDVRKKAGTRRS